MALQTPIEFRGLQDSQGYWLIEDFRWSRNEPTTVRLIVRGYANFETYSAGEQSVCEELVAIEIPIDNSASPKTQILNQVRDLLYPLIKQQSPRFEGAIDV